MRESGKVTNTPGRGNAKYAYSSGHASQDSEGIRTRVGLALILVIFLSL